MHHLPDIQNIWAHQPDNLCIVTGAYKEEINNLPISHSCPHPAQLRHLPFQPSPRAPNCLTRTEKVYDIINLCPGTLETVGVISQPNPEESLLFFMLDHDILAQCASYKCMNRGNFSFFQWEIRINRWETPKISENSCLPINLKFWWGFERSYGY